MATRKSGPLDAMVGARISMLRVDRSMSQAMLAERIGVTFQQMQKYERGANRIGASRLSLIASVLGVSVGELFESSGAGSPGLNSPVRLLAEPGAVRVLKAYARTTSPRVRLCIAKLVESIASRNPGAKATVALLMLSMVVSGGSVPREDSLPQEDERQSCAAPQFGWRRQPVARIASRSGGLLPGMNSPIQSRRVASICQDIASAE
jgi:transcriptional regulator with XRE-family HTH domain